MDFNQIFKGKVVSILHPLSYGLNVCGPSNTRVEASAPNVTVSGDWAFTQVSKAESGYVLSPPYKHTRRRSPPASQDKSSSGTELAGTWIWDFEPPKL